MNPTNPSQKIAYRFGLIEPSREQIRDLETLEIYGFNMFSADRLRYGFFKELGRLQ